MAKNSRIKVTPEMAAAERVWREKARRSLVDFSCYITPWYRPARHHHLVGRVLEQVLRYIETEGAEGIGRLIVSEPPRHGKTEQISRQFPAYLLGRLPDSRVILTSYGADLAQDDSRSVRQYVTSDRFQALFGEQSTVDDAVQLSEDSRAKANWDLAEPHRGGVVAAGVGGGITGKGAHLLVVDDPFKNRDEAESEAYRKRVISWWESSAYTRLEKGGAVIITHTRWHMDDLAGHLLKKMISDPLMADQYEVVFLPALALDADQYVVDENDFAKNLLRGVYLPKADPLGRQPGEALWPEKYDARTLNRIRANVQEIEFSSLYQQMPRPASGGFFDEQNFQIVDYVPGGLRWFRYVDLALGKTKTSDYNATLATALDPSTGDIYYRDMLRVRELTDFLAQLVEMACLDSEWGTVWGFEDVAFQALVLQEMLKNSRMANKAIVPVRPDADKVQRARAIQARARQGRVKLVRGAWNQAFITEALVFPHGKNDDQIDTASGGLQMIAELGEDEDDAGEQIIEMQERVEISPY